MLLCIENTFACKTHTTRASCKTTCTTHPHTIITTPHHPTPPPPTPTQDHLLNDEELKSFQLRCFNAPLAPEELTAVKQVVADKVPQGITPDGSLTFHGFLFLHALFIERGRTETPWAVLRTYGYDNYLKLSDEVLDAVSFRRAIDQVRGVGVCRCVWVCGWVCRCVGVGRGGVRGGWVLYCVVGAQVLVHVVLLCWLHKCW